MIRRSSTLDLLGLRLRLPCGCGSPPRPSGRSPCRAGSGRRCSGCESVAAATIAPSVMRTPWCSSYFSLRPRRIEIVSSTVGSPTNTGWKRRCSAGVLLDVLLVLVERGRADAVQLAARQRGLEQVRGVHRAFAMAPAPISVCISSMNRMISPSAPLTSSSTALSRSSNSPRYFAPAIRLPMSSAISAAVLRGCRARRRWRCAARGLRRSRSCRRRARRSAPDCSWCGGRGSGSVRRISSSRPMTGSSLPSRAAWVRSRAYFFIAS